MVRLYASCSNGVFLAQLKAGYDFGVGHGGVEEGVVYHFGEVGEGGFDSGFVVAIGLGENAFHVESEICSGSEQRGGESRISKAKMMALARPLLGRLPIWEELVALARLLFGFEFLSLSKIPFRSLLKIWDLAVTLERVGVTRPRYGKALAVPLTSCSSPPRFSLRMTTSCFHHRREWCLIFTGLSRSVIAS